jgi:serine/threonine-protein kinase
VTERIIAGRYRPVRRLGQGAMGDVWLADDVELERPVALKLLAPDADHARFEREARAAAALNHPNVTRLFDFGHDEGRPFMALEYLSGGSLEDRLAAGDRLPDDLTEDVATQLAAGLAHAHAQGLVHRDLKPSNILFDAEGRPKIADFGIASIRGGTTLTDEGTVLGTAGYISPEQATGQPATPASDVYSLGVVLFRMLTGRLPFEGESAVELAGKHVRLDAPPVADVRPDAPARLAAVTASALARDPRARPQDGAALERALRTDQPAAPESATLILDPPRPPRPQRTRTLALATFLLLLLAVGGVAAAFLLTRSSDRGHGATVPAGTTHNPTTAATTRVESSTSTPSTSTRPGTTTQQTATAPPPHGTTASTTPPTTEPSTTDTTTEDTTTTAPNP